MGNLSVATEQYRQELITVGASAGGVEALQVLAAGFPVGLGAAVCVVLHIGRGINGKSYLPEILTKAGPLPALNPRDGEALRKGCIYVAPPDYHLQVEPGRLRLVHGPKENFCRPAVNPLFRSAAAAYGPRVTGVILTGTLDDGVAGLAEIKRRGGGTVVQDPSTALFPGMPQNAIEFVGPDHVVQLHEIAPLLARLALTDRTAIPKEEPMERTKVDLTCPECRGPLWKERQGQIVEYRCRVGHCYSPLHMAQEHDETVERSLWSTVVALEEAAEIAEKLAPELGPHALEKARRKRAQAAALKDMLAAAEPAG
jgi:two-component system chemotaxis response regulator CheB